ncbi:MAG TPA: hypothetical protein VFS42_07260, partial [Burkholderiaceae bacterium]|nr:hypothetical protein [Burkholderiaceae bacterium]
MMSISNLFCCLPFARRPDTKSFDAAIEHYLPSDPAVTQKSAKPAPNRTMLERVERLLDHKLRLKSPDGKTGLSFVQRNRRLSDGQFKKPEGEEEFMVRVPRERVSRGSNQTPDYWVPRSETETKLHVVLQRRIEVYEGRFNAFKKAISLCKNKFFKQRSNDAAELRHILQLDGERLRETQTPLARRGNGNNAPLLQPLLNPGDREGASQPQSPRSPFSRQASFVAHEPLLQRPSSPASTVSAESNEVPVAVVVEEIKDEMADVKPPVPGGVFLGCQLTPTA